jgi:PucR family transcriptional regulator, purine catabolism regulatory protein
VASLNEVRAAIFPAAVRLSSSAAGARAGADRDADARDVGWVRVMRPRVPAFDAVDPADLVVVPIPAIAIVAPDDQSIRSLVDALAAADVAAILLVGDDAPSDTFVAALSGTGLPAWRLEQAEPAAVERSLIGYLVNRRAEIERLVGELERRLEALALADRGLDALIGELSATLGRAVALEDRRGRASAVHVPPGADGTSVAPYAAGSTPVALRVALPTPDGARGPTLALLGDAPPTELERLAAERVAALLALAVGRDEAVRTARDAARRGDVLPGAGPPWVMVLGRQGESGPDDLEGDGHRAREALRRDVRLLAPARRLALRGDADSLELRVVIAGDRDDPAADELASRLATLLGRPVATSRPFHRAVDRPAAEAEARSTLETWQQLAERRRSDGGSASKASVARAELLPAYRLLVGLHNVPDARRQAEALLAPLVARGRPRGVPERLETLRAVLSTAGGAEAAARLGVHRNTLAYRVRRIEAATGWDLADPVLRLPLLAALELVQDDQ